MRNSILSIILASLTLGMCSGIATAQTNTPGVDWRQNNQNHSIYNGIQNGSLTFRETGQLIKGQARINRMEHRFKSDGNVTRRERTRLHRSQNRQSRRIYRKKHN